MEQIAYLYFDYIILYLIVRLLPQFNWNDAPIWYCSTVWLNTGSIQTKYGKILTRTTPNMESFHAVYSIFRTFFVIAPECQVVLKKSGAIAGNCNWKKMNFSLTTFFYGKHVQIHRKKPICSCLQKKFSMEFLRFSTRMF